MEFTIKGEPGEIATLLGSMRGIISNDILDTPLNARESTSIKHFVDTEAINELVQLAHTKRKEETR